MSRLSTHEVWVIACRQSYSPTISLLSDELYTDAAQAQLALEQAVAAYLAQPLRLTDDSGYQLMMLDEFLWRQRDAAVEEARVQEFNGECRR